jgi:hypothetical protein
MMNIDLSLGVFDNAMDVAILDVGRQFAPIMVDFVGVLSLSEHG